MRLLPNEKTFGDVKVRVSVVPIEQGTEDEDDFMDAWKEEVFEAAFDGNGAFSFAKTIFGVFHSNLTYVVFKKRVVQYFNDDLGDAFGQCSTLYQDIAKNVFGELDGVFFCTEAGEEFFGEEYDPDVSG
jgi:hypothetical protein